MELMQTKRAVLIQIPQGHQLDKEQPVLRPARGRGTLDRAGLPPEARMRPPLLHQTGPGWTGRCPRSLTQRQPTRTPNTTTPVWYRHVLEEKRANCSLQTAQGRDEDRGRGRPGARTCWPPDQRASFCSREGKRSGEARQWRLAPQWRQKVSCICRGQGRPMAWPRGEGRRSTGAQRQSTNPTLVQLTWQKKLFLLPIGRRPLTVCGAPQYCAGRAHEAGDAQEWAAWQDGRMSWMQPGDKRGSRAHLNNRNV